MTPTCFFGATHVRGVEAIEAFFIKIYEPLSGTHDVLERWTAEDVWMLRAEATMAKTTDPSGVVCALIT
jgi:hypothetical protein